jgi:hypothetical protein
VKLSVVNLDFGAPGPLSHLERSSSGRRPESSVPLGKGDHRGCGMKLVDRDKRSGSGGNCRITLALAGLVKSEQVPILLLQVTSEDPLPHGTRRPPCQEGQIVLP